MVFDNLERAIRFAHSETSVNNTNVAIFKCVGIGEIKKGHFCHFVFDIQKNERADKAIDLCWGLNRNPEEMDTLEDGGFPHGSRAFENIRLEAYVCSICHEVNIRL